MSVSPPVFPGIVFALFFQAGRQRVQGVPEAQSKQLDRALWEAAAMATMQELKERRARSYAATRAWRPTREAGNGPKSPKLLNSEKRTRCTVCTVVVGHRATYDSLVSPGNPTRPRAKAALACLREYSAGSASSLSCSGPNSQSARTTWATVVVIMNCAEFSLPQLTTQLEESIGLPVFVVGKVD